MASIKRFEEIDAWKEARILVGAIYKTSNDGPLSKDYGFRDQIRHAAVSIMSNIAEGFGLEGNKEFIHYLSRAKGAALEVQSQLYVAVDVEYITAEQFGSLYYQTEKTVQLISGFIRYLAEN